MDWTAEREAKTLLRIAALLLALASLADRACRAPLTVRFLVLVLLRPAESVAREFICGDWGVPEPAGEGYDPAAALRLAESFVALAIALAGLIGWPFFGRVRIGAAVCGPPPARPGFPPCRPEPADTS